MTSHPHTSCVTVATAHGSLRGHRAGDGGTFLGIPYAAPPVGALRWRPPQPPQPWSGVRDALAFGPDLPQPPVATLRGPRQDEDALHLNVWTPTLDRSARLPVMVWLPGGGFVGGSGSDPSSDGAALAVEGVVVVAVNYRVGLFGFLAHPALARESEHGVCGNYGLLDQIAALEWVREHIADFGGDPGRVTAFGVSAGSASIALLLTSPRADGLFHQAILQSPGAGRPLASLVQAEQAGLARGNDIAALRELPAAELLARTGLLTPKVRGLTTPRVLRPVHDGWLLPHDERDALRTGQFRAMPLLVGSNTDEGSWLTKSWNVDTLQAWREQVRINFGPHAEEAAALYPARSDADAAAAVAAMFADTQFNFGTRQLARSMARREARTWRYLFTKRRAGQADGPHHSDEVPFVFANLPAGADGSDRELSGRMRKAWATFAAKGEPGVAGWSPYDPARDDHLELGETIGTGARWRQPQLDFLERFYAACPSSPRTRE